MVTTGGVKKSNLQSKIPTKHNFVTGGSQYRRVSTLI